MWWKVIFLGLLSHGCQLEQSAQDLSSCSNEVSLSDDVGVTTNRQITKAIGAYFRVMNRMTIEEVRVKIKSENLSGMRIQIFFEQDNFFEEFTTALVDFTVPGAITTNEYEWVTFRLPTPLEIRPFVEFGSDDYGKHYFLTFKPISGSFRVESHTQDYERDMVLQTRTIDNTYWEEAEKNFFSIGISGRSACR